MSLFITGPVDIEHICVIPERVILDIVYSDKVRRGVLLRKSFDSFIFIFRDDGDKEDTVLTLEELVKANPAKIAASDINLTGILVGYADSKLDFVIAQKYKDSDFLRGDTFIPHDFLELLRQVELYAADLSEEAAMDFSFEESKELSDFVNDVHFTRITNGVSPMSPVGMLHFSSMCAEHYPKLDLSMLSYILSRLAHKKLQDASVTEEESRVMFSFLHLIKPVHN